MPGFCGGLSFGDCRQLEQLLAEGIDTEKKPVLGLIAQGDFEGLLEFAIQKDYVEAEKGYFSKCHLCLDIRKHLVNFDSFQELSPPEFYTQIDKI
jgi:hypothetical protein